MGRPKLNLDGKRFGLLLVLRLVVSPHKHDALWLCRCDCGNTVIKKSGYLTGNAKIGYLASCGCIKRNGLRLTHGHNRKGKTTRTYKTWASMLARCNNPNEPVYPYYGGRGIKVCDHWNKFENFLKDMGERPGSGKDFTLDRKDVNGDYEPGNCRWATPIQQRHNQRRRDPHGT